MEASVGPLLVRGNENPISKSRGQSTFKVYYGIMRKAAIIASTQKRRRLKKRMTAKNGKNDELLYWQQYRESQTLNKFGQHAMSPVRKSNLHRAFHTREPQVLPRMAIILPRPLQGRSVWMNQIRKIFPTRQYLASLYMRMKDPSQDENSRSEQVERNKIMQDRLQKILEIIERLRSPRNAEGSQTPTSSIKPKSNPYGLVLIFLLIILTMLGFSIIWTFPLPVDILVTFSGMFMFLIAYIYSLLN